MVHLDEFLLLLFSFHMQLSVPLKNINRLLWFWSSSTKILNRWLNRMGGRERFVNSSLKQNTKIMAPVFNRFCLSASKTLKLGGLAYQYEFGLSVHLRNVMRKNQPPQVWLSFPSFFNIRCFKNFLILAGRCEIQGKSVQMFFIFSQTDTSQNKFTHTQTHVKYSSSFVHQILPKVLSKEEKEAPKLAFHLLLF